jgi:hypothetical protein
MFKRLAKTPASKVAPFAPPNPTTMIPNDPWVLGLCEESAVNLGFALGLGLALLLVDVDGAKLACRTAEVAEYALTEDAASEGAPRELPREGHILISTSISLDTFYNNRTTKVAQQGCCLSPTCDLRSPTSFAIATAHGSSLGACVLLLAVDLAQSGSGHELRTNYEYPS